MVALSWTSCRSDQPCKWSCFTSVRSSDVAYIGSNWKTKKPRKTKLCTGVPQVTSNSHTNTPGDKLGVSRDMRLADALVISYIYPTQTPVLLSNSA